MVITSAVVVVFGRLLQVDGNVGSFASMFTDVSFQLKRETVICEFLKESLGIFEGVFLQQFFSKVYTATKIFIGKRGIKGNFNFISFSSATIKLHKNIQKKTMDLQFLICIFYHQSFG